MSRYRWIRIVGTYPCPDGRKRAVYARWYANRWALAPALSGRTVYAATMRNRRITGELRGGRFIPDDTPAARRVRLETSAGHLLDAAKAAEGVLASLHDRGQLKGGAPAVLNWLRNVLAEIEGRA